jgi:hypothetical protein
MARYNLTPREDREIVRVKVWYTDAVYENPDWSELPAVGVQAVKLWYADGDSRIMNGDSYYFTAPGPNGVIYGSTSLPEDLKKYPGRVVVKGKWIDDATLYGILDDVMAEQWHAD